MSFSGPPPLPVTKVRNKSRRSGPSEQPRAHSSNTLAVVGLGFVVTLVGGISVGLVIALGLYITGRLHFTGRLPDKIINSPEILSKGEFDPAPPDPDSGLGEVVGEAPLKEIQPPAEADPEDVQPIDPDPAKISEPEKTDTQPAARFIETLKEHPVLILPDLDSWDAHESKLLVQLPANLALADLDCEDLDCELLGIEEVFGDLGLEFTEQAGKGLKSWTLRLTDESTRESDRNVASFTVHNDGLHFQWSQASSRSETAGLLRWCLLKFSFEHLSVTNRLGEPVKRKPVEIDILARNLVIPVFEDDRNRPQLPRTDKLKLGISYDPSEHTLEMDELLILPVALRRQDSPEPALELEMVFEKIGGSMLLVACECYGYPKRAFAEIEESGPVLVNRSTLSEEGKIRTQDKKVKEVQKYEKEIRLKAFELTVNDAIRANRIDLARNAEAKIKELEIEIKDLESDLKSMAISAEWEERLEAESKRLKSNKKLELTLFFEIQGQPVVILTTGQR